jgi:23S rRNA (adenine2503-C2)-methyltransferase
MTANTLQNSASKVLPLLGRSLSELTEWVESQGQPRYRGKQLYEWLYTRGARDLADITVFPKAWREEFAAHPTIEIGRSQIHLHKQSRDGTEKLLLKLADGEIVETVGIPTSKRLTVCVSTQVGCPMACDFCATGKGGFRRNLAKHEIIDQVLTVQEVMQQRVSHIVFMGMGEPLLNYENLVGAIQVINKDIGIGQRNITVSTVGIPNQIPRFAQEHLQVTLADGAGPSLHQLFSRCAVVCPHLLGVLRCGHCDRREFSAVHRGGHCLVDPVWRLSGRGLSLGH